MENAARPLIEGGIQAVNIVVGMKQIPDIQLIRIRNRQPVMDDVPLTFGNIDKCALEAAVRMKESQDGTVTVLAVGSSQLEDTIKEALAIGADQATLVISDQALDSAQSAQLIAAAVKQIGPVDLLLLGEGSGDNYSSQVGSRTAQILGWPQVGYVNQMHIQGDIIKAVRSLEDCQEYLEVKMPAVLTVSSDINQVRIPSVSQILKAGRKPRYTVAARQMDPTLSEALTETVSNIAPESARRQIAVKTVDDLINALAAEGFGGRV